MTADLFDRLAVPAFVTLCCVGVYFGYLTTRLIERIIERMDH